MTIELKHEDLLCLVLGVTPAHRAMTELRWLGEYNGSYDEWQWRVNTLSELSEEELWYTYQLCRDSWKSNLTEFKRN